MATKAQRKAQKAKRQERKRQRAKVKEKKRGESQPSTRLRQRLAKQSPRAWADEMPEDVAVFDNQVLASLSPEWNTQATIVRECLASVCGTPSAELPESLSAIPRTSPYSQWRLFIRGLKHWLEDDFATAQANWERLDPDRRPGRIASVMQLSRDEHLNEMPAEPTDDDELFFQAKLLRRVRFDRVAIRIARSAVQIPEPEKDALIGPRLIDWLRDFTKEYRDLEPDFVQALHEVALGRAYRGTYYDLFDVARSHFRGPRHDRKNSLLTFHFYAGMQSVRARRITEEAIKKYLQVDVPANKEIPEKLGKALVSQFYLGEALRLASPEPDDLFSFRKSPDTREINQYFRDSIAAYPSHRNAHVEYVDWLEDNAEDERLTKVGREQWLDKAAEAKMAWSQALPDDIEPRLDLVDYLLEKERIDDATPHVEFLSSTRHENPLVNATKWKWTLLEAMRACRRKTWLSRVPELLDQAGSLWPKWLSKDWMPFLRAALALRMGDQAEFAQRFHYDGTLLNACRMLAAAQRMRVTSADLKPLRAAVDQHVKNLQAVAVEDLLATCDFFWDLTRVKLLYPAYRMHGTKISRELLKRFDESQKLVTDHIDEPMTQASLFLMSEQRLFNDRYSLETPSWFSLRQIVDHPTLAAASAIACMKISGAYRSPVEEGTVEKVREAAESSRDAFYRHWFKELADELVDHLKALNRRGNSIGSFGSMFSRILSQFGADDDDDYDDGPEQQCNCDKCRAARGETLS
ncbi:hypothetical protein [Stieleria varia]|uniref:Uncharacterized protein n=1 Tax=Stieleria varia TaxID=2528005 RepID=A0A5C6AQ62_9BACT|nr:hypothetical protein [Stieleria varia]TWU01122.1 hypothetical protein Pla52n_44940 [Stieleria varia]